MVLLLAGLPTLGCRAASDARAGLKAERRGEYHLAYDLYCQSAARAPSSRSAASGMRRTSLAAFRYWNRRAVRASRRDDYPVAWKCLMRALMIRPDHEPTVTALRRLESNHADALADARRDWLLHGSDALVVADEPPVAPAPRPTPVQPDESVARVGRRALPPIERGAATVGTDQPTAGQISTPQARIGGAADGANPGRWNTPTPPPAETRRDPVRYLKTVTVSRHDDNFPKTAETVDGISIKIKDTDADPDADVDIYLYRKRIRRVKNWCVGQLVTVAGISGQRYDMVLRDITHETETIRVSVRRTRRR